jgi:hypothetical protein
MSDLVIEHVASMQKLDKPALLQIWKELFKTPPALGACAVVICGRRRDRNVCASVYEARASFVDLVASTMNSGKRLWLGEHGYMAGCKDM